MSLGLGIALIAMGNLVAVFLMTAVWHAVAIASVVGVGIGFAYSAMPTLVMSDVPPSATAASNGINAVMRILGGNHRKRDAGRGAHVAGRDRRRFHFPE